MAISANQSDTVASKYAGSGTLAEAHHELFKVSPEISSVHLAYTLLSVFTVFFGVFSAFIKEKLFAGEAIIACCVGIAFGPYGAAIFTPSTWANGMHTDEITLEITRVVIALSVFAVGVELPRAYVLKHWRSLIVLLGPVMLFGWIISAAFIYLFIPGLHFLDALVVAACVTPTDPILAASVVGKGKFAQDHVPAHIRHILQAESGSNDGAAFPFLYFALFWILRGADPAGTAIGWWIVLVVLYQILFGICIGAFVGIMARKLLKFSKYRSLIDRESMVAMYLALALLVTGLTTLAGSDDLLAAFACGTAFAWDNWFSESIEDSNFSSILDLIVNCGIFFYVGATIPFASWADSSLTLSVWRLVVIGILILLLRRIPTIFILQRLIPDIRTMREAVFVGHFGPMGIGALFICTLAREKLPTPNYPPQNHLDILSLSIEPIVYFIIMCSVLVHGLSIPVFTNSRRLHRRVSSFSRTFTTTSIRDNEPAWLSRVKRIGDPAKQKDDQKDEEKPLDQENSRTTSIAPTPSSDSQGEDAPNPEEEGSDNNGEVSDVMGRHRSIDSENDGVNKRTTRWDEGNEVIVEEDDGENIHVEHKNKNDTDAEHQKKSHVEHEQQNTSSIADQQNKSSNSLPGLEVDGAEQQAKSEVRTVQPEHRARAQKALRNLERLEKRAFRPIDAGALRSNDQHPESSQQAKNKPAPSTARVANGYWWKRDEKSGLPRELTAAEKRKAKQERMVRREKHYCSGAGEVRWREGNRVIIERNDGEIVEVQEDSQDSTEAENEDMTGIFPNLHRLNSAEHHRFINLATTLAADGPKNSEQAEALSKAFAEVEGRRPHASTSRSVLANTPVTSLQIPEPVRRPQMIKFSTGNLRQRMLKRPTFQGLSSFRHGPPTSSKVDETMNPWEEREEFPENGDRPSGDALKLPSERKKSGTTSTPHAEMSERSDNIDKNIRFNLPSDSQLRRYSLDEDDAG